MIRNTKGIIALAVTFVVFLCGPVCGQQASWTMGVENSGRKTFGEIRPRTEPLSSSDSVRTHGPIFSTRRPSLIDIGVGRARPQSPGATPKLRR